MNGLPKFNTLPEQLKTKKQHSPTCKCSKKLFCILTHVQLSQLLKCTLKSYFWLENEGYNYFICCEFSWFKVKHNEQI